MLSPAKCESEETTAQADLYSPSRSEHERLSLVLSLPNPTGVANKLSDGEMSGSRPTRPDHNSPKDNGGGECRVSQRKSSSPGKTPPMLTSSCQVRKSPRFMPVDEKIDNVCSVPVNGKSGSEKSSSHCKPPLLMLANGCQVRRSRRFTSADEITDNVCSVPATGESGSTKKKTSGALDKKESLDSEDLTFKDIAAIAKSLEMEIVSECQDKSNDAEDGSQVPAKRKVDSDSLSSSVKCSNHNLSNNKRMRRSPRFTKGTENEGEEDISKSEEQEKAVASRNPSIISPRLSGTVENGHGENLHTLHGPKQVRGTDKLINDNGNCCEVTKKCEGEGPVPSGCIKLTVNGDRDKTLGNPRSPDLSRGDIHTRSLEMNEIEQESMVFSLQGKASDKGITEEMNANSPVICLSDNYEEPGKKIKSSVEYSNVKRSNGDISTKAASGSTLSSGENGSLTSLHLNSPTKSTKGKGERVTRATVCGQHESSSYCFIGEPISCEEAQERWRWRYDLKERKSKSRGQQSEDDEDKIVANVECHYLHAKVDGTIFSLGDFANIEGEEEENHVGKIVEFFKTTDGESYFRVQWFYRATDTVMKQQATHHDKRRLFYSTVMNDNPIDCIISKVTVLQVSPRAVLKPNSIKSDFYFDMEYCVEYSTFQTLTNLKSSKNKLGCWSDVVPTESTDSLMENKNFGEELPVLDLYSGCGGMSTGLSLGAKVSGVDVVTKWAVDLNLAACESLKLNHPKTQVRNDAAGDFLLLLKEWEKLCNRYVFNNDKKTDTIISVNSTSESSESSSSSEDDSEPEEYEVEKLVDICYGDPAKTGEYGLKFKVHWKGYSSEEDTWEPAEELSNCQDALREFVTNGFKTKILPLPGGVGVICGGPPCQGISGYNRFRNVDSPLTDERNQQIIVFMDIVEYLKPAFVLMENVVDILRLDKGSLGRYALSRLVYMRYQARLGIMTAGCYGLSQFRSRVFMWGADPDRNLPPFPLPTHDVIVRYGFPLEFERNVVAYDEGQPRKLEKALVLKDAISDLPHVSYDEVREKMPYESLPETDFQRYIRSTKHDMTGSAVDNCTKGTTLLRDHRPFHMSEDDYARVCQIPKRKGANFRDLPGLIVKNDNSICRDPSMKPVLLPSGRPLVPEYVFTFQQGKSKRPFARLWWDETVPTVLTVPSCHNLVSLSFCSVIASRARSNTDHKRISTASRVPRLLPVLWNRQTKVLSDWKCSGCIGFSCFGLFSRYGLPWSSP